jgi:hypothetical protein
VNNLLTRCPICGGEIVVTRIHCQDCDTTIESRFDAGPFRQLTREQLDFVEVFIRCEGKFTRMEAELELSYPTIRNRLYEIIRALGYEPGGTDDSAGLTEDERKDILEDLDKGLISAEEAMFLLQEKGR